MVNAAASTDPVEPPDVADESVEGLIDVESVLGRGLDAGGAKVVGEIATLCECSPKRSAIWGHRYGLWLGLRRELTMNSNLAFILEVALVGDDEDRERVPVLDAEDLLVELRNLLKRVTRRDGVNKEEAFACPHVPRRGMCEQASRWTRVKRKGGRVTHCSRMALKTSSRER